MKELTSNEAMEEDIVEGRSVEDRMEEIVTQVLGGRRSGHVRARNGMRSYTSTCEFILSEFIHTI